MDEASRALEQWGGCHPCYPIVLDDWGVPHSRRPGARLRETTDDTGSGLGWLRSSKRAAGDRGHETLGGAWLQPSPSSPSRG